MEISQKMVAFSKYTNFNDILVDPYPFNALKRIWIVQDIIDCQHCNTDFTSFRFYTSKDKSKTSKMNSNDKLEIQENKLKSSWNGFNGPLENILLQEYQGDKIGLVYSVMKS